jgi:hypothetical protein
MQKRKKNSLQVCGEASAHAALLGWSIDRHENEICFPDALIDIGAEEEVASASLTNDIVEARFIYGQMEVWGVPGVDAGLVQVNNGDPDMRTFQCNHGTSGTACSE